MDPEIVTAIKRLTREGVLAPEQAAIPLRAARGDLLSVRFELRAMLWAGVALITAGVGLLVRENLERIGPVTIAVALALLAAGCLAWVGRAAPPFSWSEQASPNLAFDYVLLLGATLVAADLAFIEVKFTPLGAAWPWHLFWTAMLYTALAIRFDSRIVFSLALSTFAAWRGIAMGTLASAPLGHWQPAAVRLNSLACGVAFIVGGWWLAHTHRKAHFEPVAAHMGWLLVLGGAGSGMLAAYAPGSWWAWALALLAVGAALAWFALRATRFWLFAMGTLAAYAAVSRFVVEAVPYGILRHGWFLATSTALVVGLVIMQHRFKDDR